MYQKMLINTVFYKKKKSVIWERTKWEWALPECIPNIDSKYI